MHHTFQGARPSLRGPRPPPSSIGRHQRKQSYSRYQSVGFISRYLARLDDLVRGRNFKKRVVEFPKGHDWFNSRELSFRRDLMNKIVIVHFWTSCCINCLHSLPELEYLQSKYQENKALVLVGCHSGKFTNEKSSHIVRQAVIKYNVTHPVINDDHMLIWELFGITCWPSIVVIGPYGFPILTLTGQGHRERLDTFIQASVEFYSGILNYSPIQLSLEEEKDQQARNLFKAGQLKLEGSAAKAMRSNLRFPSKIIAIQNQPGLPYNDDLIVISDSGNNRIVIINEETRECIDIIGNSEIGLVDGSFDEASFHFPQGLCHVYREGDHVIYVCDVKNHAIRQINLTRREVLTVVGTGMKGHDKKGGRRPQVQTLASPWDIAAYNRDILLIAMAGHHQIWKLNLRTCNCENFSGTGQEGNQNTKANLKYSEWAQPSGLSVGRFNESHELFVAVREVYLKDSESSSIRAINLKSLISTRTVVGGDYDHKNLHAFGDLDGVGMKAKLQHPTGLHFVKRKNVLLVSDTFNHKIKVIDTTTNEIFTWQEKVRKRLGSGEAGLVDGHSLECSFNEPQGLCSLYKRELDKTVIYITDSNNHCIRYVDYDSGKVHTLKLGNVPEIEISVTIDLITSSGEKEDSKY